MMHDHNLRTPVNVPLVITLKYTHLHRPSTIGSTSTSNRASSIPTYVPCYSSRRLRYRSSRQSRNYEPPFGLSWFPSFARSYPQSRHLRTNIQLHSVGCYWLPLAFLHFEPRDFLFHRRTGIGLRHSANPKLSKTLLNCPGYFIFSLFLDEMVLGLP